MVIKSSSYTKSKYLSSNIVNLVLSFFAIKHDLMNLFDSCLFSHLRPQQ